MPVKLQQPHAILRALPLALKAKMVALGHTQKDVEALTGVPQPQLSRALAGKRKRLTDPILRLCHYADIEVESAPLLTTADDLFAIVSDLVGDSAIAADAVRGVLTSLTPLLLGIRENSAK